MKHLVQSLIGQWQSWNQKLLLLFQISLISDALKRESFEMLTVSLSQTSKVALCEAVTYFNVILVSLLVACMLVHLNTDNAFRFLKPNTASCLSSSPILSSSIPSSSPSSKGLSLLYESWFLPSLWKPSPNGLGHSRACDSSVPQAQKEGSFKWKLFSGKIFLVLKNRCDRVISFCLPLSGCWCDA